MSSEIVFRENRIDNIEDENVFMKSDKGRSVIGKKRSYSGEKWEFLSIQRILFFIKSVFLPEGFPDSVHPDYVYYQIWDTIQAFASTILGTLTTHSILTGVGVGESTATPLAATISWILKDGAGMIGRILFAWWNGSQLDSQCKKWRIFADVLNDIAMGIELLLPYLSSTYTTLILCATTTMKSIVGVAGGATRAALTQHQALNNNLADVSAKDGSQETFVNLVASFVGIFILSSLHQSVLGGFIMYVILVIIHIYANYSAVRALRLDSLNEDRLTIVLKNFMKTKMIISVEECNKQESLLLFQKPAKKFIGFDVKLGSSLSTIIQRKTINIDFITRLKNQYRNKKYMIIPDIESEIIYVGLSEKIQQIDILQAFFDSCYHGQTIYSDIHKLNDKSDVNQSIIDIIQQNDSKVSMEFKFFHELLKISDWNEEINLLPIGEWRAQWDL